SPARLPADAPAGVVQDEYDNEEGDGRQPDDVDIPIDPALERLADTPTGASQEELLAHTRALSGDSDDDARLPAAVVSATSVLVADRDSFISFFSRINLVKTEANRTFVRSSSRDAAATLRDGGTSRAAPSRFTHPCPNKQFGCNKTSVTLSERDIHFQTCLL